MSAPETAVPDLEAIRAHWRLHHPEVSGITSHHIVTLLYYIDALVAALRDAFELLEACRADHGFADSSDVQGFLRSPARALLPPAPPEAPK